MWRRFASSRILRLVCAVLLAMPVPASQAVSQETAQQKYERMRQSLDRAAAALAIVDGAIDRSAFDIDALATKLGSDPEAMFRFVRDEIRYEPYFGVLRGARGTLIGRAGNALDRSLLLAALLGKGGIETRIAFAELPDATAVTLAARLGEPDRPRPTAMPDSKAVLKGMGEALGVPLAQLAEKLAQLKAETVDLPGQVQITAAADAAKLDAALPAGLMQPQSAPEAAAAAVEAREHYWVQYKDDAGTWIDLDTALPSSQPAVALAAAQETWPTADIPADRYHRLGVKVTLRIARTVDGAERFADTPLIDQTFTVADRQGDAITVANVPHPSLQDLARLAAPEEAIKRVSEYSTVLSVGDQLVVSPYFDLSGHFFTAVPGTDAGNAERLAKPGGETLSGIGGALDNLLEDSPAAPASSDTRIVGQWVDYEVSSPGARGTEPSVERIRRDIVAPETVVEWSPSGPAGGRTEPSRWDVGELVTRLFWSAELLPLTGPTNPDFLGALELFSLRGGLDAFAVSYRASLGLPVDQSVQIPPSAVPTATLSLAVAAEAETRLLRGIEYPSLAEYYAQTQLLAFERSARVSAAGPRFTDGYDVMTWHPRLVALSAGSVDAGRYAFKRGVLLTRMEALVLSMRTVKSPYQVPVVSNAAETFAAAAKQGIGAVALDGGNGQLDRLAALPLPPAVKVEIAGELGRGQVVVVPRNPVSQGDASLLAWWRLDPKTGSVLGMGPGGRGQAVTEDAKLKMAWITSANGLFTFALCLQGLVITNSGTEANVRTCFIGAVFGALGSYGYFTNVWAGNILAALGAIAVLISVAVN